MLLALFGAGAGAAMMTSVTAATVVSRGRVQGRIARVRGRLRCGGSTTSGSTGGGALVVSGSAAQAFMTGTPWHVAVLAGALLVFIAGLATALRGPDWPVMSARYDPPAAAARARSRRRRPGGADGPGRAGGPGKNSRSTRRRCGSR